jgi:hypothetical protein
VHDRKEEGMELRTVNDAIPGMWPTKKITGGKDRRRYGLRACLEITVSYKNVLAYT